ncbi:MAG TPA: hypothetical protein PK977_18435, partial [Chitinophagaceae bacterium]|nr:hypothetical protein [Chitinophagaceae bacterium]
LTGAAGLNINFPDEEPKHDIKLIEKDEPVEKKIELVEKQPTIENEIVSDLLHQHDTMDMLEEEEEEQVLEMIPPP